MTPPGLEEAEVRKEGGRTVVIGATGSVGVAVLPTYIRLIRQTLADEVFVVMTEAATRFMPPYTLEIFSGNPVLTNPFEAPPGLKVPHIELGRRAALYLVAPATANILAKGAAGICDDLVSTLLVSTRAPVVFVPSMNGVMWESPVVQRNVATLRELGHTVLEPVEGFEVADGSPTQGAMPSPVELLQSLNAILGR